MPDTALTAEEFEGLEESIMQTPRGRAFLKEHAQRCRAIGTNIVVRILAEMRAELKDGFATGPVNILQGELQEMSKAIGQTREDIAAIRPDEGCDNRIMAATEELDAIVTATERATTEILGAAEVLQEIADKLRADGVDEQICDSMDTLTVSIFTACSFQDITGQRTTKVVNAMHYLENRVKGMLEIWGSSQNGAQNGSAPKKENSDRTDAHLLEGPQLAGSGVDQAEVDRMLNDATTAAEQAIAAEAIDAAEAAKAAANDDGQNGADGNANDGKTAATGDDDSDQPAMVQDDIDSLFA